MDRKQKIREEILKKLNEQSEHRRKEKSLKIKEMLFKSSEFRQAKAIMFYASFDGEVDTDEMIKEALKLRKTVVIPKIEENKKMTPRVVSDIDRGWGRDCYGIKQPKEGSRLLALERIDLVIVPGLAFDRYGNRLGRGKGYYDRFLSQLAPHIPTVALAFDFQLLPCLPVALHDLTVDKVISA